MWVYQPALPAALRRLWRSRPQAHQARRTAKQLRQDEEQRVQEGIPIPARVTASGDGLGLEGLLHHWEAEAAG